MTDKTPAEIDDTEGHRRNFAPAAVEDDTEGHRRFAHGAVEDEDDTEGHLMRQ
jgi:hypothetical protein